MLPNFLCIGAQKCGTTSLWHLLNAHPDIHMAIPRETRFFSEDIRFAEGLAAYELRHFAGWNGEAAVGEKCPEYLYLPQVPQRLYEGLGADLRLLICLRSPAARAYSHYRHNIAQFRESRSFAEVVESESKSLETGERNPPPFGYLGRGLYAEQIERYLEIFPKNQCHFITFEAVAQRQSAIMQSVYTFLGVAPFQIARPVSSGRPPTRDIQLQSGEHDDKAIVTVISSSRSQPARPLKQSLKTLAKTALGHSPQSGAGGDMIAVRNPSKELRAFASRISALGSLPPEITAEDELLINRRYFSDDIARLSKLVPFDVKHWLKRYRAPKAES